MREFLTLLIVRIFIIFHMIIRLIHLVNEPNRNQVFKVKRLEKYNTVKNIYILFKQTHSPRMKLWFQNLRWMARSCIIKPPCIIKGSLWSCWYCLHFVCHLYDSALNTARYCWSELVDFCTSKCTDVRMCWGLAFIWGREHFAPN